MMESHTIKSRIKSLLGSPSIKLRKNRCRIKENLSSKVTLERVLGITSSGNSALTCDPCSGTVAYPAGCVVVLLNPAKNRQQHLINASRKTITTLSFSSDGKYLVTGENGHLPAVRVWDVAEGTQVAELQEHKYEVACVAFSPNSKYIVSVGSQHDMSVNVWAWKKNTLVAANKVSSKVTAVSFSEDSSHFVTAGNRHVRFWYLEPSQSNKLSAPVPLMGRSGLLGELQNNFFCDVACGRGQKSDSTFCITSSGLLCEFNEKRMLDKWVDLQTSAARSLSVTEDLIFCACANGTVRVFSPSDLHFICTLPRPHHLGIDVTTISQASHLFSRKPEARYPDSVAVTYDPVNHWLSCVYNDHSLYVWDTRELERVGKVHSALYHSGSVWDLQMCPKDADGSKVGAGSSGLFYSCSGDGTVRMWSTEGISSGNVLSNDLQKVIYIDDHTSSLLDVEGTAISSTDKPEGQTSESKTGIRTICVSPDGRHLASGDRTGTLRVHDLTSMKEILKAEAHDSEILCLEYSKPETGMNLLATASRDRLIHVLDVEEDYGLLQTLDEHSSSITAVHFAANEGKVRIISCGADKSIYFRTAHRTLRGTEFKRSHHVVRKTTPYDMDVDPNCKYAAVSCQDRSIRVFNISSGKLKRSFKGSQTEDGGLLKIQIDPSGLYVATSCSDKNISLFDFQTGECLAAMFGHSEVITSLKFTSDCRHLISASGDSCIFVWRLAPELTVNMRERLSQLRRRQSGQSVKNSPFRRTSTNSFTLHHSPSILTYSSESEREEEEDEEEEEDVKRSEEKDCHQETNHQLSLSEFSIEEEPGASDEGNEWNPVKDPSAESSLSEVPPRPRRRWSCRIGSLELMVKSMLELRQLDSLSKAGPHNRGPVGKLRVEERGSTASLQECKNKRRPHSAWLAPATTPEPEGVVLYPEHCLSTTSLPGPAYMIQSPAEGIEEAEQEGKTEEAECHDCLSPISGFSMGYGSGGSSPEQDHDDSDDPEPLSSDVPSERGEEVDMDRSEISSPESSEQEDTLADNSGTGNQIRPKGTSSRLHGQKSTSRSGSVFLHKTGKKSGPSATVKPTVTMVKPLIDGEVSGNGPVDKGEMNPSWRGPALRSTSQRNHPYLGRTASPISKPLSGLQKSNSIQNLAADTRKSLTPSRLKREACPSLPKLIMEKNDSRTNARHPSSTAPSSPQPWESPNFSRIPRARSYMSPTTSSIAKITRSVSIGDGLHLGTSSNEASFSTPPSSPSRLSCPILSSPSTPGDPKQAGPKTLPSRAVKPRVSQRMSSPFAEFPSRATPTTHNDSFHKNSFEFKALHVDPSSDPEPDETIKLPPSTITSYPKVVEDHLQPETFSQALQSERPQVAVKAFTVTSDAPGDQGLPRRRSSSIFLTSVPLCLPLHHCSPGIVPLCFTPFFSLSSFSSHHRVAERSVNLDSCRQAAAELCSSVRKTTQLYRTLMSSDGEGCPEQQQMRQVLSEALFCVRSELDCVPRPGPAMMGEEGLGTLALLEQYSKLLLQSVENRLQHNL